MLQHVFQTPCSVISHAHLVPMRMLVPSLGLLSGLKTWCCHELWCRLQMWLGSLGAVAVLQAGSCSSNLTPSMRASTCCGCSPKKRGGGETDCTTNGLLYFTPQADPGQRFNEGSENWRIIIMLLEKNDNW